jgi:hypothetical protein
MEDGRGKHRGKLIRNGKPMAFVRIALETH